MFALSLRSLDGACHRLSLGADATLAEVRVKLEDSLPELCEAKLFQDTRELTDDSVVEVELHVVVTKSPFKILAKTRKLLRQMNKLQKQLDAWEGDIDLFERLAHGTHPLGEEMMDALRGLEKMEELNSEHSQEMWALLKLCQSNILWLSESQSISPRRNSTGLEHSWNGFPPPFYMADIFGRLCKDPATYIPDLASYALPGYWQCGPFPSYALPALAACSLLGITARCEDDALTSQQKVKLIHWAELAIASRRHRESLEFGWVTKYALRVLGAFSSEVQEHHDLVKELFQYIQHLGEDDELYQDAAEVLQQLCARRKENSDAAVGSELALVAQAEPGSGDGEEEPDDAAQVEAESGVESDPVFIHQQDLQEAIMRSKADGPAPISYDDSVAIFRQTRVCEDSMRALRMSHALAEARKRVEDAGCNLFPVSANGACLLVPLTKEQVRELDLQLDKYHILALRSDKPAIDEALRMVDRRARPRLRDDHRAGPLNEVQQPAEDAQGPSSVADGGSDIFEDLGLLRPHIRAKIKQLMALNNGLDDGKSEVSMSLVTESAPCGDAACEQSSTLGSVNPRHWKLP